MFSGMRGPEHLNALRAFDAAARHLSFALAAEELNVTPAAVGQLVRRLEEVLGVELFHRSPTGPARLILTEAARAAVPDLRAGEAFFSSQPISCWANRSNRLAWTVRSWRMIGSGGGRALWAQQPKISPTLPEPACAKTPIPQMFQNVSVCGRKLD